MKKFVPTKSFYKGLKVINEFVNPYIEQALSLSPEELATKTKSEEGYTFLHALASFTRDRKVLLSPFYSPAATPQPLPYPGHSTSSPGTQK
jgi:hypothetical protein